jgi:hypothetical protein
VRARLPLLALSGHGVVWRGDGRERMTHQNLAQSLIGPQLPFTVYFSYESVPNMF